MATETNFNVAPYYDDFDEEKNFHRILFVPATAVQARELTQLQTIQQNQIERLGENLFKDGTIIKGCTFNYDNQYHYIKVADLQVDGQPLNPSQYNDTLIKNSANLQAYIVNYTDGLETQNPDLNTFFVKYINSADSGQKAFANDEILSIYNKANTSQLLTQVRVANSSFTDPVGIGYSFRISDGVIFQKGFMTRVDAQTVIISKYSTLPDQVSVGFNTVESIVNNFVDSSLSDNAQGFSNENAPGAHRLKLTPTLVVKTTSEAASANNYFPIVEWENGAVTKQRQQTEYSQIGRELARRTSEESGNYVVKPFTVTSEAITGNTSHILIQTSSGLAYINGYRAEQFNNVSIPTRKGTDVKEKKNQIITPNFGNYIFINEYIGNFAFNKGDTIQLYDSAATKLSSGTFSLTAVGNQIGTAKILSLAYWSGTPGTPSAIYKLYLFDIAMNSGMNFSRVKSVFYNGTNKGVADVVLTNGNAVLQETSFSNLIYPFGQSAIKTLRDSLNNNDTQYFFRTVNESVSFNSSGMLQLSLTGNQTFPYSANSTLNETQEQDIVVVARSSANGAVRTGNSTTSSGSNAVSGNGTSFLTEYSIGDYITLTGTDANNAARRITSISNNIFLNVDRNYSQSLSGVVHRRHFPSGVAIPIVNRSSNITLDSTQQILTINIGENISGTLNAVAFYDVNQTTAIALSKLALKDQYVKINCANNTANTTGTYCLGLPDVYSISGIWKGTGNTYSESGTNVTNEFSLVSGQRDTHYGLSFIAKKASSSLSLANTDNLLVKFNVFQKSNSGGGLGFFSVDSYPVDDSSSSLPVDKIRTASIPVYLSSTTGIAYDLRNCVDFRPVCANNSVYANTINGSTLNPVNTLSFGGTELNLPSPNKNFQTDIEYYVGRIDKLEINQYGALKIIEGIGSETPSAPPSNDGAMTLGIIDIPPYPTLSAIEGAAYNRPDYAVKVAASQQRRYTMSQISTLDQRISSLEYYTSLSLLEKNTKDLVIPSDIDGTDRFKNGIFVDPFNDLSFSNVLDQEFKIGLSSSESAIVPRFEQYKIDLQVQSTSNTARTGDIVSLPFTHSAIFEQNFASRVRNCTETFWNWTGKLSAFPSYDSHFEVRSNPIPITPSPVTVPPTQINNVPTQSTPVSSNTIANTAVLHTTGTNMHNSVPAIKTNIQISGIAGGRTPLSSLPK